MLHAPENLWEEVVYLGYHLHWDMDQLLDIEHGDRSELLSQVADLNARAWAEVRQHV